MQTWAYLVKINRRQGLKKLLTLMNLELLINHTFSVQAWIRTVTFLNIQLTERWGICLRDDLQVAISEIGNSRTRLTLELILTFPSCRKHNKLSYHYSLRKQPTFRDASTVFPAKWRLKNESRNSILMTFHYPNLGGASDWSYREGNLFQPIRSTTQIWVVTRYQYANVGCFLRLLDYDHVIHPG